MNMSLAKLAAKAAKHGALAIALATSESSDLEMAAIFWFASNMPSNAALKAGLYVSMTCGKIVAVVLFV